MRLYNVRVNGRNYNVSADPLEGDRLRVVLDNKTFESESLGGGNTSTWIVRSGDEAIRAACRVIQSGSVDVWISGLPFSSSVQVAISTGTSILKSEKGVKFGGEIRAMMPGRITSILVHEGEVVEPGDPLLIFEAMKMLNEVTSHAVGRVKKVNVREGQTVAKDAILLVVE